MHLNQELEDMTCQMCTNSKQIKAPGKGKLADSTQNMTVYADICGQLQTETVGGKRYFLTVTTTSHRYKAVTLL